MPIVTGNGGFSPVLAATTRLTDAQILALNATPITIATGTAGFAIMPLQTCLAVIEGGSAYTGLYDLRYFIGPSFAGAGWGGNPFVAKNLFNTAGAILGQFVGAQGAFYNDQEPTTLLNGQPLRLDADAAVGGGDGTGSAIIYTVYALVPLT